MEAKELLRDLINSLIALDNVNQEEKAERIALLESKSPKEYKDYSDAYFRAEDFLKANP